MNRPFLSMLLNIYTEEDIKNFYDFTENFINNRPKYSFNNDDPDVVGLEICIRSKLDIDLFKQWSGLYKNRSDVSLFLSNDITSVFSRGFFKIENTGSFISCTGTDLSFQIKKMCEESIYESEISPFKIVFVPNPIL